MNDSIRTYCCSILGAQMDTRSDLIGIGTSSFDAQEQFLVNVENAISKPFDIPAQIKNYQRLMQNASSKIDFVVGIGLYMCPNNMELKIGTTEGYNNKILFPSDNQTLGLNDDINSGKIIKNIQPTTIEGTKTREPIPVYDDDLYEGIPHDYKHENIKMTIIGGSVLFAIIGFIIYEIY